MSGNVQWTGRCASWLVCREGVADVWYELVAASVVEHACGARDPTRGAGCSQCAGVSLAAKILCERLVVGRGGGVVLGSAR